MSPDPKKISHNHKTNIRRRGKMFVLSPGSLQSKMFFETGKTTMHLARQTRHRREIEGQDIVAIASVVRNKDGTLWHKRLYVMYESYPVYGQILDAVSESGIAPRGYAKVLQIRETLNGWEIDIAQVAKRMEPSQ